MPARRRGRSPKRVLEGRQASVASEELKGLIGSAVILARDAAVFLEEKRRRSLSSLKLSSLYALSTYLYSL